MMNKKHVFITLLTTSVLMCSNSFAQQQPDAGQSLQTIKSSPSVSSTSAKEIIIEQKSQARKSGGPKVQVKKINIDGNNIFSNEELLNVLGDYKGEHDLAGLKNLADKITAFYHSKDYPFARAILPAQKMNNGKINILVIEGSYGSIKIESDDPKKDKAEKFLSSLKEGEVIKGKELERVSLILDDQPGYDFTPIVEPGKKRGEGNLSLRMKQEKKYGGSVQADNHGNRYTGRGRALANFYVNSPFTFGDKLDFTGIYTEENLWYGSAFYSRPLNDSGLRGKIGVSHTYYELGKNFSALGAQGTADVVSVELSYPIIRSMKTNLILSGGYHLKWLTDEQSSVGSTNKKKTDVIPLTLSFDRKDSFGGGGVSYGAVTWTHGVLDLDSTLATADRTTARSEGHFDKINFDFTRLQLTSIDNLTGFARVSAQKAFDNLDSSEDFSLGGVNGVRAFPTGEGFGDEGYVIQLEARYKLNDKIEPYLFYDQGYSRTNQDPWVAGNNNRNINGAGIGFRLNHNNINIDASAAWSTNGGSPVSDSRDEVPVVWLRANYSF